jgi:hypothetical protein
MEGVGLLAARTILYIHTALKYQIRTWPGMRSPFGKGRRRISVRRERSPKHIPGDDPWQTTHVVKTLWPPQPGTVALRDLHGAALVCVRYRRDLSNSYRYTTVEVVVAHAPIRHRKRRSAAETVEVSLGPATYSKLDQIRLFMGIGSH